MAVIRLEKAMRKRHCHKCNGDILPGEYHLRATEWGQRDNYNLCAKCVKKSNTKIQELNHSGELTNDERIS